MKPSPLVKLLALMSLSLAASLASADLASITTSAGMVERSTTTEGTIKLELPAPTGGLTITLASSGPGLIVPATVKVGAGNTVKKFSIQTTADAAHGWYGIQATQGSIVRKVGVRVQSVDTNNLYEEAISVNDQQKTGNAASGIEPLWGDGAGSAISGDSRFVVFTSSATNLVSGDTNGKTDVFLRDRTLGTTKLISRPATGQSNGNSYSPTISGDGRTVAFVSEATNLSGEDLPGADIFVYGTWSGVMKQVTSGNAASYHPCLSREGRIVAFTSEASNLVFDDINDLSDVFAYDRLTNATQCVSIAPGGASGPSRRPSISGDKIVFESEATNLVVGDGNDYQDIYLRDLAAQTTTRVSVWGASSLELDGWSYNGVISGDGSKLFFRSAAPDPGSIVGSGYPRFFRRDMVTGATIARYEGTEDIAVSFDGRFVAVVSQSDGDPSSGVHVLDDFGHVASFSVPLPPSHVSLSEDGLNLTYMFQRAVGAFDYNLKKDVALLTVAPQRPIEITTLPSKYVQSNGILGLKSATARLDIFRPGPATVKLTYVGRISGPSTVFIPAGETSANFDFTMGYYSQNALYRMFTELAGRTTLEGFGCASIQTHPDQATIPASATTITGVAAIGFLAPAGGFKITVSTTYASATPKYQDLTIPAGATEIPFTFNIPAVSTQTSIPIKSYYIKSEDTYSHTATVVQG